MGREGASLARNSERDLYDINLWPDGHGGLGKFDNIESHLVVLSRFYVVISYNNNIIRI